MIWLTSDFHFNHQKPFVYEPRGFTSPEEMNNILIQNFNAEVGYNDDVYILGDLMLGGSERFEEGLELISALNGKLHLVRGNHDSNKRWEAYKSLHNVVEMENAIYLDYRKYHFYLSHYPSMTSNYDDEKGLHHRTLNLCGHSHTQDKWLHWLTGSYHCEVDCHNNTPILLDVIINDMKIYEPPNGYDTVMAQILNIASNTIPQPRCEKCVYAYPGCGDYDGFGKCKSYRRDPPDGGYYG